MKIAYEHNVRTTYLQTEHKVTASVYACHEDSKITYSRLLLSVFFLDALDQELKSGLKKSPCPRPLYA